jgi:hypothetical protein
MQWHLVGTRPKFSSLGIAYFLLLSAWLLLLREERRPEQLVSSMQSESASV